MLGNPPTAQTFLNIVDLREQDHSHCTLAFRNRLTFVRSSHMHREAGQLSPLPVCRVQ